jgi:peptidoglycan hydrolase CwlO-like protein
MAPEEDKIRVTARISKDLDTRIHRYYNNMAPAIIEGLELLSASKEGTRSPDGTNKTIEYAGDDTKNLEAQLGDKDRTIGDKERNIGDLERQLGDKVKTIGDKEREIEFLKSQITIKDQQIDKQAFSLQSVIQENSRLNVKLLPESPIEKKKPWYKFW